MTEDPFKEYLIQSEPSKREKGYAWQTAIGLQEVDGLTPSQYLINTALRNIEGEITLEEVDMLLHSYYEENPELNKESRVEEADKVSVRIARILSEEAFTFSPTEYLAIHRKLFEGIYKHAGKIRTYNITKKEWVLGGETVIYGSASELLRTLEYDFEQEKKFQYNGLSTYEIIKHLSEFISRLWQIHVFEEGNTRTTAVFFIKYLKTLGFDVTNDIFAANSWYFRNALVRANYRNLKKEIYSTFEFVELFLRNLLLDESTPLKNRELHINWIKEERATSTYNYRDKLEYFSDKNKEHIKNLYDKFNTESVFGRKEVMEVAKLKTSRASEIIKEMLVNELIEKVEGYGKGKYKFRIDLNLQNSQNDKIYELETRRNLCFEFLLYLVSDLNINKAGISWEKLILIDERAHNEESNWIFAEEKMDIGE